METKESVGITDPHEHDVLSGRGNFVNYHSGNENFRALVRKHKVEYVKCPKPQKGKFSQMIVDEIRSQNPPGRFLKQDAETKLWYDIGEKKALDKTRQALREGAPELMKEITVAGKGAGAGDNLGSEGKDRPVQINMIGNASVAGPASSSFADMFKSPEGGTIGNLELAPGALLTAPQLLTPNMMMMSPEFQPQLSSNQMQMHRGFATNTGNTNCLSQALPVPQLHNAQLDHLQQNIDTHHQRMLLMSQQLMNQQAISNGFNSFQQFNNNNNNNNNTQSEVEQALLVNAKLERERLMMQNKHSRIYSNDPHLEPTPLKTGSLSNKQMTAAGTMESISPKVEKPTGRNPRRKVPNALLEREDSLDKIFASPGSQNKKDDFSASIGGLSAMSMSIADIQEDGNLSAIFDNSLKISDDICSKPDRSHKKDKKSEFDMSIATVGETGSMSVNTLTMHELLESDTNGSSLGNVFSDM